MCTHTIKNSLKRKAMVGTAAAMLSLAVVSQAMAESDKGQPLELSSAWLAAEVQEIHHPLLVQERDDDAGTIASRSDVESEEVTESGCPISLSVSYALYSDYIFRFINFSEYESEGREKPNHQLTTEVGLDLGDFGSLAVGGWFEWYAAQKQINGEGANIQEIDYYGGWTYNIDAIATELYLGLTWYTFPNDKAINTFEYNIGLAHNDAWMWKWLFPDNEDGVLNPTFALAHDVDALGGVWMEFGFSHTFEIFENFTLTPGYMLAWDAGYLDNDCGYLAGDQWSLVAEYDLGSAVQMPDWAGSLTLTGELYFNNPYTDYNRFDLIDDVLWGGFTVNWSWGG